MIRFSSLLLWTALTILASAALYHTSYRVHELSQQLHGLNNQIEAEQRNIHVLKAEWVYLTNPQRIEQEAQKYLSMRPASMQQISHLETLHELLPTRSETMADVTVNSTPIALPSPVAIASAQPAPAPVMPQRVAKVEDRSHVNTRMVIQRAPSNALLPSGGHLVLVNLGSRP